jgi:hypothetical protein
LPLATGSHITPGISGTAFWVEAIKHSKLEFSQILLVDDGSNLLPSWDDVAILHEEEDLRCDAPIVLYHFNERLGRLSVSDFPGWVRSFFFASRYAEANGFSKIVHIEADAFLISARAIDYVNTLADGWTAFWCKTFRRPESCIQIITGTGLDTFKLWAQRSIESFAGTVIEKTLPFSHVEYGLIGDRYGENGIRVPANADWCAQAYPSRLTAYDSYESYFWWMPWFPAVLPALSIGRTLPEPITHPSAEFGFEGISYVQWIREAEAILGPSIYFEIGTHAGDSLRAIKCDAVCVDPKYAITSNVIGQRRNTHFFQGTSDEFFADKVCVSKILSDGIDVAFLDGLHLFEALLRDLINTERFTNAHSMVLLHDCLPLNERMAERCRRHGDETEPERIRDFWTGDVWKVIPVLRKYRPDIRISYLNCPPTGLVVCTGLDKRNHTLSDAYDEIVREFEHLPLRTFGLERLWQLCPMYNAEQILANSAVFGKALYGGNSDYLRHPVSSQA